MVSTSLRRRLSGFALILAAATGMAAGSAASAQEVPEVPTVVSPLRVETDHNNVNLVSGRTTVEPPVLSVPAAPNLRFDRVQNAAPHVSGRINPAPGGGGGLSTASFSVHNGSGGSESFRCIDFDCTSVTGTGSTFIQNARIYRQAGTGAVWTFNQKHVDTLGPPRVILYYAASVSYPNGETISYTYQTAFLSGDPFNRTFYRPTRVTSNLGYHIDITYHPGELGTMGWNSPAQATLYASAAPTVPLGRMAYSADGTTITQYGAQDQNPRTYACTGCANALGLTIEGWAGSMQLPTEGTPTLQVSTAAGGNVVGAVTRDGVGWNYGYTNLRLNSTASAYLFDRLTVTGPNGFNQVYDVAQIGLGSEQRNVVTRMTDSINRSTSFTFDEAYRPTRIVYPEGNEVSVAYDDFGNLFWRRTRAKPGTGLADIIEEAHFPTDTCYGGGPQVLCYRPLWSRDGLNRQTDYAYNGSGQLTEQTDPADANGVRRRTIVEYATAPNGLSRRSVVRVCGVGTTCGTNQEIRTEYEYFGNTLLVSRERRVDPATGQMLDTNNSYDSAGRLLSTDGPLTGTGDVIYNRYDAHGRRTWEIGAVGANGVRTATQTTYRDADDKVLNTQAGTVSDPNNPVFVTLLTRTDITYDARRNPIREAVSESGTTRTLLQRTFDDQARLECEARRMNPVAFASLPSSACALGPQGTGANAFGPDRITHNAYDAAGQLLQVQRAYGITTANGFPATLQQNYATYTYSPNGKRTSVTDANGNRAEMTYDGHDRQRRWIFPSPTTPGVANPADYEEYGYDLVGNRTSLRKRDNSTLTFQYDNLNRMIVKVVPERAGLPSTHTRDVFYGYDLRNQPLYSRFDSHSGEGVSNAYDAFGRQTSSTLLMDGVSRTLASLYDVGGRRERLTHPDGQAFTYTYSPASQLTGVYQGIGTGTVLDQFSYNQQARLAGRSEGGGSSVAYTYDPIGRLGSLTDTFVGGTGNVALGFTYNPASQITSRTRNNDAYASNTAYNVNRDYSVNGLNQYSAAGTASFTYDASGNLTSDGSRTFTYDVENRLVAASGGVSLRYDPLGRLYEVVGPSGTTRFLYDGDALVGEFVGGALTERYVHGSNAAADDPLVWYDNGTRRYLHANHQGSIVAVTTGGPPSVNAYDEWGIPNGTNSGRFQYTGQAWVPELGMYHYKARIYSPTLGRFLQTDPVGYDDQINLYTYVGNDPVNMTDPTGMAELEVGYRDIRVTFRFEWFGRSGVRVDAGSTSVGAEIGGGNASVNVNAGSTSVNVSAGVNTGVSVQTPAVRVRVGSPAAARNEGATAAGRLPRPGTGLGTAPRADRDSRRTWSNRERAAQREAQGGQCANRCGTAIDQSNSRGHHVVRWADGGRTDNANHVEVCTRCHEELHSPE